MKPKSAFAIHFLTFLASAVTLFASCSEVENTAYSDFVAFGTDGWDAACVVGFSPYPADSILSPGDKFDLIVTLRYSARNLSGDIPLEITEEDEEGVTGSTRVNIRICDNDGKPIGKKGIALYEISDTIRRDFSLPEGYSLSISSLSPPENTLCLRNLGITLSRVKK